VFQSAPSPTASPITCETFGSATVPLSNGELAIALIVPSLRPAAREIRLAAALLGALDVQADEVADVRIRIGAR
jgi:hypothetical protein